MDDNQEDDVAFRQRHELTKDLVRQYTIATQHYAWAVAEMNRQIGIVCEGEYRRLGTVVDDARLECETLRAELGILSSVRGL
jgi:hypothetical protein